MLAALPVRKIVLVSVLAALTAIALLSLLPDLVAPGPRSPGATPAPSGAGEAPAAVESAPAAAGTAAGAAEPDVRVTTPPAAALRSPGELGERPTACLRIVDAATQAPIGGAAIYRFDNQIDTAAITYTDAQGLAALPLRKPEQLIVAMPGYLLRMAPTQLGSSAQAPQQVQLEADRYSFRVALRFTLPDGGQPGEVLARFAPVAPPKGNELEPPPALKGANESVQRAWNELRTIGTLRPVPEVHVQLGQYNAHQVFRFGAEEDVSFCTPGLCSIEAATRDGFVGNAVIDPASATTAPVVLHLQRGKSVRGFVRSKVTGGPVGGAEIVLGNGDPLRLSARSGADGRFEIGPLTAAVAALEVRHRDHEVWRGGPFAGGTAGIDVVLTELPQGSVRGRVRARPGLAPIADARVSMPVAGAAPAVATTDADGVFVLRGSAKDTVRIVITAPGYQAYSELLDPGAPLLDFDLWPADAKSRIAAGMTGSVSGVVVDERGIRLPGVLVRLTPDRPLPPPDLSGRRVLLGGQLLLPTSTSTGPDGAFEIELPCSGPATLSIVDPANAAGPPLLSQRVELTLGKVQGGLQLQARRP